MNVQQKQQYERLAKRIVMMELYGNYEDSDMTSHIYKSQIPQELIEEIESIDLGFENDIDGDFYVEMPDFVTGDEDETIKVLSPIMWYEITAQECECNKFIQVEQRSYAEFHRDNTFYCRNCGSDDYIKGFCKVEKLDSEIEIENAVKRGYKVSKEDEKILKRIYPSIEL